MSDGMKELYGRTLQALSSGPARRMNFYAGFWPINAGSFMSVYTEIVKFTMNIREGIMIDVDGLPDGVAAMYNYKTDTLIFANKQYGATWRQQATIIHESVHAWVDIQGHMDLPSDADNEAAAYVTEALFYFYATGQTLLEHDDFESALDRDSKPIRAIANRIATSIVDGATRVSDHDRVALVDAVVGNPVYQRNKTSRRAGTVGADGLYRSYMRAALVATRLKFQ